jgi:hypothetical protein
MLTLDHLVDHAVDHKCHPRSGSWRFVAVGAQSRRMPEIRLYSKDPVV